MLPQKNPEDSSSAIPRVPPGHDGLQVNYCKNPNCNNIGVAIPETAQRGAGATNSYIIGAGGKGMPTAKCTACGEHFPLKSNLGIAEEFQRMMAWLAPLAEPIHCPNETCANHAGQVLVGPPGAYASFGKTAIGNPRWRCNMCRKTFSANTKPTARQRQPSKNRLIFKLLVNKSPLTRIADVAEVNVATVFHRLDFIHRQCLAFAAERERKLQNLSIRRLYLSMDRQDYRVNWKARKNRRNVVLSSVAAVDNETGYCFAAHMNFDPDLDPEKVEEDAKKLCDSARSMPHRRYARPLCQDRCHPVSMGLQ